MTRFQPIFSTTWEKSRKPTHFLKLAQYTHAVPGNGVGIVIDGSIDKSPERRVEKYQEPPAGILRTHSLFYSNFQSV